MKTSGRVLALLLGILVSPVLAQSGSVPEIHKSDLDMVWTLLTGFLVFFMQAGFAMVETGFTRAKNAVNILAKNLMDFAIGSICFFLLGFGIMFGASKCGGWIGVGDTMLRSAIPGKTDWTFAFFFFQLVFAATSATIVSGAMAERTKFGAYLIYSAVVSLFIYPISGHWAWASAGGVAGAEGWLQARGFIDFAGSSVVHSVGGWVGLTGTMILGPRLGKYSQNGRARPILGHNMPLSALGVFILWFCWFGFNPGSTLSGNTGSIARIAVTTCLAASAGANAALFTSWMKFGKPDLSMALNGTLAGLVAITAGCANVSPTSSIVIGLLAGVACVFSVVLFEHILKIDDPVGAVSVHGVCGTLGTLCVGLFAEESYGGMKGLFFGGGTHLLLTQTIGAGAIFLWAFGAGWILFKVLDLVMGIRVSQSEEIRGLDIREHGMEAYAGFQIFTTEG